MTTLLRRIKNYYTEGMPERVDFSPGYAGLYKYIIKIFTDMPSGISRLLKLQPVMALISGSVVILLLRKGFDHAPFAIVFFIFVLFYLTYRLYLPKNRSGILSKVTDVAVMFLINDMLLFVLPFYFESMTFLSRNMLFGFIIISLAIITNWYYLFERLVLKSVFVSSIYYALVFFCVLNFILPIIFGMRNIWSLSISGGISAIIAVLFVYPHLHKNKHWKEALKFISGIILSFCFLWFGRSCIPPAPLKLLYATACENIENQGPVMPYEMNYIENTPEIFFFSAIFAPKGLSERIDHVWYRNGKKILIINLSEIKGGRKDGYRTWSKHVVMEGPGKFTVQVWTSGRQLLGEKSFVLKKSNFGEYILPGKF
jgi:hypothetical protein